MSQANRAILDGTEYTFSSATVDVSPCAPTYATSHRWGWPDARGFAICVCGAVRGTSGETVACHVHAPGISTPLYRWHGYEGLPEPRDPVEAERQRFARLKARPFRADGTPDVTVQSLGEWVGPDVQAAPTIEALEAQGLDAFEIDRVMTAWGREHGIVFQWSYVREEWFWGGNEFRLRQDIEDAEFIYHEARDEGARDEIKDGGPSHGGIVRLGCELREADGVTPR